MNGICHFEISTTDLAASRDFFRELLAWGVQEVMEKYWLLSPGDGPGGGLELVEEAPREGSISIYVEVESIDETLEKAGGLGGVVVAPRTEIGGGFGFYARLREPGGAVIGLYESAK